jgi:hypothetical protein
VPATVFPLRDHALEAGVFDRVVLDMHRESFHARIKAGAFWHGPALEHPVQLQAKIVMQPARSTLLDHEEQRRLLAAILLS